MAIEVTSGVLATLRKEADRAAPDECCGILFGSGARIDHAGPAANVHPEPARHFEICPAALIAAHKAARAGGAMVIGYYHSHPHGPARPSATDTAQRAGDGRIWAIASKDAITFWRDDPGGFTPLDLRVV